MSGIFGDPADTTYPGRSSLGGGQQGVILDNIYQVSPLFLGDLTAYFTQNPFPVPIDQVTGFNQITPYAANIKTAETTTSTTFVDLATPGPQLTGLPDGSYAAVYGAAFSNSSNGIRSRMAISVNGGIPDVTLQAFGLPGVGPIVGGTFGTIFVLSQGGNNTLKAQYSVNAASTGTFESRWIIAIRITGP